jgi:hypothetical protein
MSILDFFICLDCPSSSSRLNYQVVYSFYSSLLCVKERNLPTSTESFYYYYVSQWEECLNLDYYSVHRSSFHITTLRLYLDSARRRHYLYLTCNIANTLNIVDTNSLTVIFINDQGWTQMMLQWSSKWGYTVI